MYSHWTKAKVEDDKDQRLIEYSGRDILVSSPKHYVLGREGGNLIKLDSGTHTYDFTFQLPDKLPASFEASLGHIRYHVEVLIEAPFPIPKEFQHQFTVVADVNLNDLPEVKVPCKCEEVQTFCCCYGCLCCIFCPTDPLTVSVALPYAGFCKGQNIPVVIDFDNQSDIEVLWTKVNLNRITQFTFNTPKLKTKTETEKVLEVLLEGVPENGTKRIEKNIPLPQVLMCSTLDQCKTIQISYELIFEFEARGMHMNIYMTIPVTIGTIPLDIEPSICFEEASAPAMDSRKLLLWLKVEMN